MERVNFVISKPLQEKLRELSKTLDLSMSDIVRRALEAWIKENADK
jgi:predicted DNA-binding protein